MRRREYPSQEGALPIDVAPIRAAEFPVAAEFLYFNHAGVSPIPASAAEAATRSAAHAGGGISRRTIFAAR